MGRKNIFRFPSWEGLFFGLDSLRGFFVFFFRLAAWRDADADALGAWSDGLQGAGGKICLSDQGGYLSRCCRYAFWLGHDKCLDDLIYYFAFPLLRCKNRWLLTGK